MRKALLVGIDAYEHIADLHGCVNDAYSVKSVLDRNGDGTRNFDTRLLAGTSDEQSVSRHDLRTAVQELFADDSDIALFYFSGHGYIESSGGYICASDTRSGDDGLSLHDVMSFANSSMAKNKVIILDSCYSGGVAQSITSTTVSEISEGVTILTASTATQAAIAGPGDSGGVFTNLLVDAISGAAANLVGEVTPGSVYAHIDQSLGAWAQRPVFKTNVRTFVSLREVEPPISLEDLRQLTVPFERPGSELALDPSYEPKRSSDEMSDPSIPDPDPVKNAAFALLQRYVKVNLVRPVGATHMYFAAMERKGCELTVLGQHYWNLVSSGRI